MAHTWSFFRAGGVDQVQLTSARDLAALGELDQKLWVALTCPVKGLELDERTLALIDADHDGRVHANELIEVARWTTELLVDPELLVEQPEALPLAAISTKTDEGKLVHDTAAALLESLGKDEDEPLAIADVKEAIEKFNLGAWNGDGVLPAAAVADEAEKQAVLDVLACTAEPATDKGGEPGITAELLARFYEELAAHVAWLDAGESEEQRPLGDDTPAAYAAYAKVAGKIDDFFTRCRVAAFDPRALNAVNREESEYLAAAAKDLQITADEVAHFPLAHVESGAKLPLGEGLNPAWIDAVEAFRAAVVVPLIGARAALSYEDWLAVRARMAAQVAWQGAKAGAVVEALGPARARELAGGEWRARLEALIAKDEAARPLAEAREKVEKLVYMCRDLMSVANNFVSFRDFYARKGPAMFQVGTLYIDQRACELCILVNDAAKHATMSVHAKSYLLYCDLKNAKNETKSIVAAVTNGDTDNLMVGRNGLFYDRKGSPWDATVTRIVDNPISVRQAFWAPYKKLLRLIEEQVARRAAAAEASADASIERTAAASDAAVDGTAPAAPASTPNAPRKIDIGVVAALGVAVGGITAALGMVLESFFGLGLWMPLGVLGLILIISGPSMAIAWLKLRQRNLGPLLDANGWAVNAMAKVNVPFGEALTKVATLPSGSKRDLFDPFAEKKRPWKLYVALLLLLGLAIGWYVGALDAYLPWEAVRSTEVLGDAAPATVRTRATQAASAAPAAEAPAAE